MSDRPATAGPATRRGRIELFMDFQSAVPLQITIGAALIVADISHPKP
jgi:hypothetical protein